MALSILKCCFKGAIAVLSVTSSLVLAADPPPLSPSKYRDIASACPTPDVQSTFVKRGKLGEYRFHAIDIAAGEMVNLDLYEVEVTKLPQLAGKTATPKALFEHFRTQLSTFLDPAVARFLPHGNDDGKRWASKNPVGSLMVFEINVLSPISLNPKAPTMHSEQGAVLLTQMGGDEAKGYWWRFSTVNTPKAGDHPVSGTREFGIRKSGNSWVIYTRGIDRATGWLDAAAAESMVFKGADLLWRSMQQRLVKDISDRGGEAKAGDLQSMRIDWEKSFVDTKIFDSCNWAGGSLGTRLDARGLRSALALAIERDQTGAAAVLAVAALRAANTPDGTEAVIRDIETTSRQLRAAASPVEIDKVISSELGRKLNLSHVRAAYDTTKLGYVDFRRDRGAERHMIGAVIDAPVDTIGSHNITRELLSRNKLKLDEGQLRAVLSAVTLSSPRATLESYVGSVVDEKGRATITEVITTFSQIANGPRDPQVLLNRAKTVLLSEASARLNERLPLVKKTVDDFSKVSNAFNAPAFRDLERGNMTADSILAGSNALRAVADLFGQEQLVKNIDDASRFVNAGMDVYKGVSLLAAGFSGGTFFAATSILSGVGGLNAFGGGGGESQAIAAALGQLTALINRQFEQVNWKLDEMRLTLGKIERQLVKLEGLQIATLSEVRATHELVTGLYYRIDRLEANLLHQLGQVALDKCWSQVTYPRPEVKDFGRQEWLVCLRAFSRQALLPIQSTKPNDNVWSQLIELLTPQAVNDRATLWRHAAIIANADALILEDPELAEISEFEQRTNYLAGAQAATEASVGFSALIKRRGRDRIRPDELGYYIRNNRIEDMLARLDAVSTFQRKLAGDKPADRINSLLAYYERQQAPLVKTLQNARIEAIRALLPHLNKENTPFNGALKNCTNGNSIATLPGDWKKDLPEIAHTHAGFYQVKQGHLLVSRTVLQPLMVCRNTFETFWTINNPGSDDPPRFSLKAKATYKAFLFDKSQLDFQHEEWSTKATDDPEGDFGKKMISELGSSLNSKFASALRKKFEENGLVEKLEDEQVSQLSASVIPEVQIRILGATSSQLGTANTQTALMRDGGPVDGTLALLRGHLSLAFPVTYLSHDRLRAALEGGVATRVGDLATIKEALRCAVILQQDLFDAEPPSSRIQDGNVYPARDTIEKVCGKNVRADIFTAEKVSSFDAHFGIKVKDVAKIVNETDWEKEAQYRTGPATLAAAQLRAFMADGDKAWFYP